MLPRSWSRTTSPDWPSPLFATYTGHPQAKLGRRNAVSGCARAAPLEAARPLPWSPRRGPPHHRPCPPAPRVVRRPPTASQRRLPLVQSLPPRCVLARIDQCRPHEGTGQVRMSPQEVRQRSTAPSWGPFRLTERMRARSSPSETVESPDNASRIHAFPEEDTASPALLLLATFA